MNNHSSFPHNSNANCPLLHCRWWKQKSKRIVLIKFIGRQYCGLSLYFLSRTPKQSRRLNFDLNRIWILGRRIRPRWRGRWRNGRRGKRQWISVIWFAIWSNTNENWIELNCLNGWMDDVGGRWSRWSRYRGRRIRSRGRVWRRWKVFEWHVRR